MRLIIYFVHELEEWLEVVNGDQLTFFTLISSRAT
jgi:hypothetical protein